jgi:hypothetical protein
MPQFLSEDFLRNKTAKLMAGRAERVFRDSKLTGFLLRVRRGVGDALLPIWLIERPARGKKNPSKVTLGDYPTFDARKARAGAGHAARSSAVTIRSPSARPEPSPAGKTSSPRQGEAPAEAESLDRQSLQWRDRPRTHPGLCRPSHADITTAQIAAVHARKADKPTDANNALRVLSKMMGFAAGEACAATAQLRRRRPMPTRCAIAGSTKPSCRNSWPRWRPKPTRARI